MWSNKVRRKFQSRSANVKSYLGGFQGLNADADDSDHSDNENNNSQHVEVASSPSNAQPLVSVLVEIPEEFDIADAGRTATLANNRKPNGRRDSSIKDDSAAVSEIGNNLDDLDNYMMSVFHMNDDASVYTKATTDTTFSCSNSSCSTVSTRRRHRGAAKNRRRDDHLGEKEKGSTCWLESMKKSSMNIFLDGEEGWTPKEGWRMTDKKKEWDSKPDGHWNEKDPFFDPSQQRLETDSKPDEQWNEKDPFFDPSQQRLEI